jgi:hypothetical protein
VNTLPKDNPYLDLRDMALSATAESLGLELSNNAEAFGVVIDVAVEGGSATFTAFRSGDASMYTSAGGGMIGGGSHEKVSEAAIALVEKASEATPRLTPTADRALPLPNRVRFYVLTNGAKFFAEDSDENFFTAEGKFADLFLAANNLITELRQVDEDK